ncbi:hypothetical protein G7Y89_g685 [Cudoniella acicularis]|uniref:NAD-dependent epimerase/dehydratase domain-containing protein n=1 Tax=Cudoniella acicularis TaxID=354080 RepID=A0A8H4RWQ5_9HELO|nr:hypothetical protein G7Y89_g685 [Cudoniella acicularis]
MSAQTSRELVLVTGANGFIAARTIEAFLEAGYDVRGTVRSEASGVGIQEALKSYVDSGRFEVVVVEDITRSGAFDKAVAGCHAIAHLAAPVSLSFTDPVPVLHGAIVGTETLLNSAHEFGANLKTVVLMSSIAAILSPRDPGYIYSEKDWNEKSQQEVARLGSGATGYDIYAASKTAAEQAFWKFRDNKKPSFAMTAVNPTFVGGPPLVSPENPEHISGTVRHIWTILSGAPIPPTLGGSGSTVDIRDVARLMVFAVKNPKKANGQRYLAVSAAGTNEAIADILREKYPDRASIIKGEPSAVLEEKSFDISGVIDNSKAVEAMGGAIHWVQGECSGCCRKLREISLKS